MSSKPRLLFVDDEPEILELLALTFREFDSETVENTEAALQALRMSHFDVLITDIKMPGNSGLNLIDFATKISPTLAVIVITGHHLEIPADANDKVSHWILKPF